MPASGSASAHQLIVGMMYREGKFNFFNDIVNDYKHNEFTVESAVFRTTCLVDYIVSREDPSVSKLSVVRDSVRGFSV